MEPTWYWRRRHRGGEEDRDELDGEVHGETEDKRGVSVAVTSYTALHSAPTDRWRSSPNCPDSHLAGSPPQLWSERWRDRQGGTRGNHTNQDHFRRSFTPEREIDRNISITLD